MKLIVIISIIVILLIGLGRYITIQEMKNENLSDPYQIYNLVNDYRASNGLKKLKWNPAMCEFANVRLHQIHSDWSHNGFNPEVKGYYPYTKAGENLAKGSYSANEFVKGWIASGIHRKDIVDPQFTDTCVQTDTFHDGQFAVQEFASF